ncbi:MAG: OmpH family outer membrane protein [Bacteroidota bacterium]
MRIRTILFSILAIILSSAVSSCQNNGDASGNEASTTGENAVETVSSTPKSGLNIVFIDGDSLQNGYAALKQEFERLEENLRAAEANHQGRVRSLQNEFESLQNQIQRGELSQNRIAQEEQRLQRRQQEILQQQQLSASAIQQEQMDINAQFSDEVETILESLKAENGYDFVFSKGIGLLMADDAYDVTALVLDRLNSQNPPEDVAEEE